MNRYFLILLLLINTHAHAQEIELVLPEGHGHVTNFKFYQDGKRGVSLEIGEKCLVWDIERGQLLAKLLDSNALGPVTISPDEKVILIGQEFDNDTTLLLVFSTDSLKLLQKIRLPFCSRELFLRLLFTFSENSDRLLLQQVKEDRKMSIDIKKGKILSSSFSERGLMDADFSDIIELQDSFYYHKNRNIFAFNQEDTLAVNYRSTEIKLTNRLVQPLQKIFSRDDQRIYLVYPGYISKLDATDGKFTPSIISGLPGIRMAAVSMDEKLLAIETNDRKIELWDIPRKFKLFETEAPAGSIELKFDYDARMLFIIKWAKEPTNSRIVYRVSYVDIIQGKLIDNNAGIHFKPEFVLVMNSADLEKEAKISIYESLETFYDSVARNYFNNYSPDSKTIYILSSNITMDGKTGYFLNSSDEMERLSENQQYELSILARAAFGKQVQYISMGPALFSLKENGGFGSYFYADAISNRSKYLFREEKLYNFSTQKELLGIYFIAGDGYLIRVPDNYYMAVGRPNKWLNFRKNQQLISFEQLDVKYNRPDKVLEAIGNTDTALIKSYRKAWEKRIKKLGIDTTQFRDGYSVPEADFVNRDNIDYEQKNGTLSLHIKGMDSTYQLDRFNVWVNETPLFGQRGISIKKRNSNRIDTTITIKLSQGENRIETSITNVNGTESYRMPLTVNYTPAVKQKESLRFIGIGIDRFADNQYNLQYSSKDIRDLAKKLKEKYGNEITIDTLFNENVTTANVKAIKQKLQQTTVNDKIIISYSGHGLLSKDFDYYLSTYNTNFSKPEENGLPYDELENLLDSIPARKKLLLIDACHSGEVDKEELQVINTTSDSLKLIKGLKPVGYADESHLGLRNSFELMQNLFVNVGKSTGATVISAAAGTQFALERNDLKNGVFTFSILEAMQKNPTMKISELKKFVGERVEQLTNGLQKPTSRNETIAVDWTLW